LESEYDEMRKKLMDSLRRQFRPEFLNRVDGIIVFRALNKEHITQIVDLMIEQVGERLLEYGIRIELTDAARMYLAEEGYDPEYGARPLRRVIQNKVEDALSDLILAGEFTEGMTVLIDHDGEQLVFVQKPEEVEIPAT
ncbi:MAG TPA: ATP-dependent Clp protease ATP-binding subunit ClpC, partial [Aggregatilineales bacterium]|nr:ATP-dependent Clp protease ATP-binding subunit ClpC [Aggregatilineales bacterium]